MDGIHVCWKSYNIQRIDILDASLKPCVEIGFVVLLSVTLFDTDRNEFVVWCKISTSHLMSSQFNVFCLAILLIGQFLSNWLQLLASLQLKTLLSKLQIQG